MKQKRFADLYIELGNGKQAAIKTGYSEKTAEVQASRLLSKAKIKNYIGIRLDKLEDKQIAKQEEVLRYLTAVMRGTNESEAIIIEGTGFGRTEAKKVNKKPDEKERLKAAELLGKRYRLFTDKVDITVQEPTIIAEDLDE